MELYDGIVVDVAHVEHTTFSQHFWMLMHHEPADVRKEEASIRIVRIGISFREFVVHTMITNPFVNGILARQCKAQHQNDTHRCLCFVRTMSPEAMSTACNTETANTAHQETYRTKERNKIQ